MMRFSCSPSSRASRPPSPAAWLLVCAFLALATTGRVHATHPLYGLSPTTPVVLHLSPGAVAQVQYVLSNRTRHTRQVTMIPVHGLTQVLEGAGFCAAHAVLGPHQSCLLTLAATADELPPGGIHGGPVVCTATSSFACAQPAAADSLDISVSAGTH